MFARAQQREQDPVRGLGAVQDRGGRAVQRLLGRLRLQVIQRAVVDQDLHRQVGHGGGALEHAQTVAGGDRPDRSGEHLPVLAHVQHRSDALGRDHAQHPLLGLGNHDLERLHPGLAQRDLTQVDVDPDLALAGHLRHGGRQASGPQVLQGGQQAAVEQLQAALEQLLLRERVADLNRRALGLVALAELGAGQHRGAADPVAAGQRSEQHDDVPRAGRGGADQALARSQPQAHRVDQAVLLVARLEVDLAADRRHADRVAVVADPGDGLRQQVAGALGFGRLAEAQRVQHRNWPRTDREHVAEDAADAGCGSLERLDRARVVVRLDLERDREPVADVDCARVLAGSHQHVRSLGREATQQPL